MALRIGSTGGTLPKGDYSVPGTLDVASGVVAGRIVTPARLWGSGGIFQNTGASDTLTPHYELSGTATQRMKLYLELPDTWPAYQVAIQVMRTAAAGEANATWTYLDRQHDIGTNNNAATTQRWQAVRAVPGSALGDPEHYQDPTVIPITSGFFGERNQILAILVRSSAVTATNVGIVNVTFLRSDL